MLFRYLLILLFYICIIKLTSADTEILIKTLHPPKCSILKDSKVLLCPRIMEIDVQIEASQTKKLINCVVFSEEEEVLAYGENYIYPPTGKIYLTIRQARRKIHEMKLIASASCKFTN